MGKNKLKKTKVTKGQGVLPAGCVGTQKELGAVFGVSERTVRQWVREDMPKLENGYYDILEINTWVLKHGKGKKKDKNSRKLEISDTESIDFWDLQSRKATAELKQVELAKLRGELVSIDEVTQGRVRRVLSLKNSFLGLGRSLAPILAGLSPVEIQAQIDDRVTYILNAYADGMVDDEGRLNGENKTDATVNGVD
ncbi:MAG: terminase small subunit [Candidatus Brocadiaceae bacterium]|nr:terminase small subunit [Candidatus Brocadiaceae bacterium]